MSSILDALKKAQMEEKEKKEKGADRVVWLVPRQKKNIYWAGVALAGMIVLVVGIVFWGILFHSKINEEAQPGISPATQIAKKAVLLLPKPPATKASRQAPNTTQSLTLSGILWDDNEPYALINSQTVKKGDQVNGAEVIEIRNNEVEVFNNGTLQTLSLEKE